MIKSFTAVTREIDDPAAAAAEILAALDLENNLLKHSLGLISCFSEFEDTGALKAICGALPFDCIGATTCICSAADEVDQVMLAITVLTSDDCEFKTAAIHVTEHYADAAKAELEPLLGYSGGKPALLLSYFPLMNTVSGDLMLAAIDRATGGIPLFGTTAVDHNPDYGTSKTIRNGETFRETVVLGGIYGSPNISFEIASLNEEKIRTQKAIITSSEGNILTGVNGKNVLEYLESIGLTKDELASGLGIVPLVIDHRDGTKPVARSVFAVTPDGRAVCGGAMPVGATLGIGSIDKADVISTTENVLRSLTGEDGAVLCYSCVARFLALGADYTAEAERFVGIDGNTKYLFAYSGGEICPLPNADGKLINFFHNYTAVFCRLS